jgi:hypothetical protein
MIYNVLISDGNRDAVIDYIKTKRRAGKFTVVDVGGSVEGWSASFVDAIIDFNDPGPNDAIRHFKCDITHPDSWVPILAYVEEHGKFDFCICTHTLEDIMNPGYVSEQLCAIATEGYVAVPSKHRELSRFEAYHVIPNRFRPETKIEYTGYRGYIHHRWIFTIHHEKMVGFPKIGYLDSTPIFDEAADFAENKSDLSFFWEGSFEIEYMNANYLGPTVSHVVSYYDELRDPEYV